MLEYKLNTKSFAFKFLPLTVLFPWNNHILVQQPLQWPLDHRAGALSQFQGDGDGESLLSWQFSPKLLLAGLKPLWRQGGLGQLASWMMEAMSRTWETRGDRNSISSLDQEVGLEGNLWSWGHPQMVEGGSLETWGDDVSSPGLVT